MSGKYTAADWARAKQVQRDYHLTLLMIHWPKLSKRQRRRIRRVDSLIYRALLELAEVGPRDQSYTPSRQPD